MSLWLLTIPLPFAHICLVHIMSICATISQILPCRVLTCGPFTHTAGSWKFWQHHDNHESLKVTEGKIWGIGKALNCDLILHRSVNTEG